MTRFRDEGLHLFQPRFFYRALDSIANRSFLSRPRVVERGNVNVPRGTFHVSNRQVMKGVKSELKEDGVKPGTKV